MIEASDVRIARRTIQDGLPGNALDGLFYGDGRGTIWLFEGDKTYRIRNRTHERTSLAGGSSFYVDREGSTWIGTVAHGLHRLRDDLFTSYTEAEGRSLDRAYPVLQDRSGTVWIGSNAGLTGYAEGRFRSYGPGDGLPSSQITSLFEDKTGKLWVGTGGGLAYRQGNRFIRHLAGGGFLGKTAAYALLEDRHDALWIGTRSGLFRHDGDRVTRYSRLRSVTRCRG